MATTRARNRSRLAVLAVAGMTLVAACGTRLPDEAFVNAGGGAGEAGAAIGGDGDLADGGSSDLGSVDIDDGGLGSGAAGGGGGGSQGGGSSGSGSSGGGGGTGGGGTGSSGGGGGGGGGGAGGKANYASDEGVTATEIRLGNITARGGPLGPETFSPPFHGARAFFAELNAQGGINGRQVKIFTCDDAENPERNKACARTLMNEQKVFAFLANSTDAHATGTAEEMHQRGVPDVGSEPIGSEYYRWPNLFSILGAEGYPRDGSSYGNDGRVYVQTGSYRWFKQSLGIDRAAVIFYAFPDIAKQAGEFIIKGLEAEGIEVVYTPNNGQGRNPADPSFDQDVLNMQRAGAQAVWQSIDIAGFQRLCAAIDKYSATRQLKAVVGTVNSVGDKVGRDFSSPCRNHVYANTESWPYSDVGNAEVKRFQAAMAKHEPNVTLHQWALEGWVAAKLFTEAATSMGADLTREGLIRWLDGQRKWKGGGLMAGIDWRREPIDRNAKATECLAISQWQDSAKGFVPRAKPFTCFEQTSWIFYSAG